MSQRLGFSFNKFERWEKGKTKFLWKDLRFVCEHLHLPLADALRASHFRHPPAKQEARHLLQELQAGLSIREFANFLGRN